MIKRYGVVEIGTRGVRLLVADASEEGIEQFVFSTGGLSDLGRSADANGNLSKRSIERVSRIVVLRKQRAPTRCLELQPKG